MVQRACLSVYSVFAVYSPVSEDREDQSGDTIHLKGIFDENRVDVTLLGSGGMDAIVPKQVLEIIISDLGGIEPMVGDEVTINGLPYHVQEVYPNAHGWAVLHLSRKDI